METETGVMLPTRTPDGSGGHTSAGLILLFAPDRSDLPAAFLLGETPEVVVGREPPPGGLRIAQRAVSRRHAALRRTEQGWEISDLGSSNGTVCNGRAVASTLLKHHDVLRIGDALFKFVSSEAEHYAEYALDDVARPGGSPLVGGLQIRRLEREIERIAAVDLPVLIFGETGTGKEVVARTAHAHSGRAGAFVAVNCAAVPAGLLESELFGHRRGAFSGATHDKVGVLQAAHGGTLLLDEVGDMPLEAQAKLLRALETREVVPVGSTQAVAVDLRVISATHRDLAAMVREGDFRGDLYARIAGHTLTVPPLRERKEDLFPLARHFLALAERPELQLGFSYMVGLCHHDWPFNVRELKAAMVRSAALTDSQQLDECHLPDEIRESLSDYGTPAEPPEPAATASASPAADTAAGPARQRSPAPSEHDLRRLLAAHGGNLAAVGRALGKDRAQVHRWVQRYGIDPNEYR